MKILLIVPPFATTHCPSTSLSTIKAILGKNNIAAEVIYSNIMMKKKFGFDFYERMINSYNFYSLGECIFSDHAFYHNKLIQKRNEGLINKNEFPLTAGTRLTNMDEIEEMKKVTENFLGEICEMILAKKPDIVGFTLTFQQICSSLSIANQVKAADPGIVNVIGGFNCLLPMGKGHFRYRTGNRLCFQRRGGSGVFAILQEL